MIYKTCTHRLLRPKRQSTSEIPFFWSGETVATRLRNDCDSLRMSELWGTGAGTFGAVGHPRVRWIASEHGRRTTSVKMTAHRLNARRGRGCAITVQELENECHMNPQELRFPGSPRCAPADRPRILAVEPYVSNISRCSDNKPAQLALYYAIRY